MQKINKFLAVLAATLAATFLFAACNDKPDDGGKTEEPVKYTVTYSAGEGSGTAPAGGSYKAGATFALPDPTGLSKDGCTFDKWNDGTTDYAVGATYTMPAKNVTFTATWKEDEETPPTPSTKYTVTFRGGVGVDGAAPTGGSYEADATFILPAATGLSKPGYLFDKWNDGTTDYAVGATYTMPAKNVTFTATWKVDTSQIDPEVKYSVTVVKTQNSSQEGSITGAIPIIDDKAVGEKFTIPADTFAFPHYTQTYWRVQNYNSQYGSWDTIANYAPSAEIEMPAFNVRIVAVWAANPLTITFDANGGSGTMAPLTSKKFNDSYSSVAKVFACKFTAPTGGTFQGWATSANGQPLADGTKLNENIVGLDDTLTLYAIWEISSTPTPAFTIDQIVGQWSGGSHTFDVAKNTDVANINGFGVLDGKYAMQIIVDTDVQMMSSIDYDLTYYIALNGTTLVLTDVNDNTNTITLTEKAELAASPSFAGKWARVIVNGTQPWVITESKAYYGNNLSEVQTVKVGANLIMYYEAVGYYYSYVLTKSENSLNGFFDASEKEPAAQTFNAGEFFTLTVDGKLNQIVNNGSAPNSSKLPTPTAPEGQVFSKWVVAGTSTEFDVTAVMTSDVSIEASFTSAAGSTVKTFTGSVSFYGITITSIRLNTQTGALTITYKNMFNKETTADYTAAIYDDYYFLDESTFTSGEALWIQLAADGNSVELFDNYNDEPYSSCGTMNIA